MTYTVQIRRRTPEARRAYLARCRQDIADRGATAETLAAFDAMAVAADHGDPLTVPWTAVQAAFAGLGIALDPDTLRVEIDHQGIRVTRQRVDDDGKPVSTAGSHAEQVTDIGFVYP